MYTCERWFKKRVKKGKERKTGKKLKKCRPYDTVMLIVFHGVSIFELITRGKRRREISRKKGKGKSLSGQRESTGFGSPLYAMFLMDVQLQNSDT